MASIKLPTVVVMALALILLGVLGSILPGMFVALFFGSTAGWRVMLITGILLATWFPIKMLMDRIIGSSSGGLGGLPQSATLGTIGIVLAASIVLIPFLWMMSGQVILIALLVYAFSRVWWAGLFAGLLAQVFFIYRTAQLEKETGKGQGAFFMQMRQFGNESIFMSNFETAVRRSSDPAPYLLGDEQETVITFDEDDEPERYRNSHAPDTITIDPDRQSD